MGVGYGMGGNVMIVYEGKEFGDEETMEARGRKASTHSLDISLHQFSPAALSAFQFIFFRERLYALCTLSPCTILHPFKDHSLLLKPRGPYSKIRDPPSLQTPLLIF